MSDELDFKRIKGGDDTSVISCQGNEEFTGEMKYIRVSITITTTLYLYVLYDKEL